MGLTRGEPMAVHMTLFVDAATTGKSVRAWEIVEGILRAGGSPEGVLVGVLAPAQRKVGQLWEAGQISIAEEHVATGITELCLERLWSRLDQPSLRGRVLLTGVEGEWHTLTSRMVATAWRAAGLDVVALTPSLPSADLQDLASRDHAAVAGISCSLPAHLLGAWYSISALRTAGLAVVVGGRAFDQYPHLGPRLGADLYLDDPFTAAKTVAPWVTRNKVAREPAPRPGLREAEQTIEAYESILFGAQAMMQAAHPGAAFTQRDRERLELLLQSAISALVCEEANVLLDHVEWQRRRTSIGAQESKVVWDYVDALVRVIPGSSGQVRELLNQAMQAT